MDGDDYTNRGSVFYNWVGITTFESEMKVKSKCNQAHYLGYWNQNVLGYVNESGIRIRIPAQK